MSSIPLQAFSAKKKMFVETAFAHGSILEMSLACFNVPRMDIMSKSDPFCVVYAKNNPHNTWQKLGITETIVDTHTCKWVRKFFLDAHTVCSNFRFEVYDRDSARENLEDHDFIGFVEGEYPISILESEKSIVKVDLSREGTKPKFGKLAITLDWIEKPLVNHDVVFHVSLGYSVRAKMFFQVMRKIPTDTQYVPVYRSELLAKDDTHFKEAKLKLTQLAAGSTSRTLRLELYHFHPMGRSKVLGFVRTSVDDLSTASANTKMVWHSCNNGFDDARVHVTPNSVHSASGKVFHISISE